MEENRDYHAYRYGDHLTPGSELKIEHSVVCENVDISTLITMGTDSLEQERPATIIKTLLKHAKIQVDQAAKAFEHASRQQVLGESR